jgi:hypothetical protein
MYVDIYDYQGQFVQGDYKLPLVDRYGSIVRIYLEKRIHNGYLIDHQIIEGKDINGDSDIWVQPVGGAFNNLVLKSATVYRPGSLQDTCGNLSSSCIFKVFKNGAIVHTETRTVCPEVEKIPCKLSDINHSIEIKKLPYLEKVEVVPYAYSAYKLPGVTAPIVQADKIPAECLNIYNNAIYVIPPSGIGIYSNATPFDSFVAQICSAPGCPPPEYQVICDCQCQTCPGDTCPIECGDRICCYNDYGVSVQSIPKSDYCGGAS